MKIHSGKIIHYIQKSLYERKQPSEDGYYIYLRKELAEAAGISASTFDNCKQEVIIYFSSECALNTWAKYEGYEGEILYTDVKYEKGKLKFKRNPLTFQPELAHLWALPPLNDFFAHDYFDEKHRRRWNGSTIKYDAIPWSWDADLWEEIMKSGRAEEILNKIENPPLNSILMQQAKDTYALVDVILLQEGYQPKNLANALYRAVGAMLPELCEFLLSNGANPNEIVQQGYSSMQCVEGMDRKGEAWEKVVRLLIDAGGDLTWGNFNAYSFAGAVFSEGSDDLIRYYIDQLYNQKLLSVTSITGKTPLSVAKIYKGEDSEIVKYIKKLLEEN